MSLSKQERQAWHELERVLADDFPSAGTGVDATKTESSRFPRPRIHRTSILITALMAGLWILLIGALAHLLPMALTGLVVICVAVNRLHQPPPKRAESERLDL